MPDRWLAGGLSALALVFLLASAMGAEPRRLTTDGRLKRDPVFVGKGAVVYVVEERPTQMRLMRLALPDGRAAPLHPEQTKSEFEPAFSPDGRYVAFVQSRGNLSLALVIEDTSTGKESSVKPAGGFSGPRSPGFSADGKRVLYAFPDKGRQQILSVDLLAGHCQLAPTLSRRQAPGAQFHPGWQLRDLLGPGRRYGSPPSDGQSPAGHPAALLARRQAYRLHEHARRQPRGVPHECGRQRGGSRDPSSRPGRLPRLASGRQASRHRLGAPGEIRSLSDTHLPQKAE